MMTLTEYVVLENFVTHEMIYTQSRVYDRNVGEFVVHDHELFRGTLEECQTFIREEAKKCRESGCYCYTHSLEHLENFYDWLNS